MRAKAYCGYFLAVLAAVAVGLLTFRETRAYSQAKTLLDDQGIWLEEKVSKAMLLAKRKTPPEIVFIGSSRVQYNVDTALFEKAGIPAFNFGVAGLYWEDYPFAINRAVESGAKVIVISIRPDTFVNPLVCPLDATLDDLAAHIKMRGLFNECIWGGKEFLLPLLYSNRFKKFLGNANQDAIEENYKHLLTAYNTNLNREDIAYIYGEPYKMLALLKDGNGVMFSSLSTDRAILTAAIPPSHEAAIKYLRLIAKPATDSGATVIVLLQPMSFTARYTKTDRIKDLGKGIGVLDASNLVFEADKWADFTHFNEEGRRLYTRRLLEVLKPLVRKG